MNNIFFGGMARYYVDAGNGDIKDDPLVPSVNTISQVTRFADGHYEEVILDTKMPGLLGASANYIPVKSIPLVYGKIVDYDRLPIGKTLIGYIYVRLINPKKSKSTPFYNGNSLIWSHK